MRMTTTKAQTREMPAATIAAVKKFSMRTFSEIAIVSIAAKIADANEVKSRKRLTFGYSEMSDAFAAMPDSAATPPKRPAPSAL